MLVASSAFAAAAAAQARALGADVRWVTVPHPIQNRTDGELRALADAAIAAITGALTGDFGGSPTAP